MLEEVDRSPSETPPILVCERSRFNAKAAHLLDKTLTSCLAEFFNDRTDFCFSTNLFRNSRNWDADAHRSTETAQSHKGRATRTAAYEMEQKKWSVRSYGRTEGDEPKIVSQARNLIQPSDDSPTAWNYQKDNIPVSSHNVYTTD
jgi:hypothetical protein